MKQPFLVGIRGLWAIPPSSFCWVFLGFPGCRSGFFLWCLSLHNSQEESCEALLQYQKYLKKNVFHWKWFFGVVRFGLVFSVVASVSNTSFLF